MGDFANSLFSALLGWISGMVQWLWQTMGSQENGGLIGWIGENWLALVLGLCAVCMVIDALVHLLRWKPHKVWASFFRRLSGRDGQEKQPGDSGRVRRQWVYADGTTTFDEVVLDEPVPEPPARVFTPLIAAQEDGFSGRHSPYERPAVQEAPVPAELSRQESTLQPPRERTRRRRYIPDVQEDMPLRYAPPPKAEDAPAYNAPYIPPQWKKPSNTGAATLHDGGSSL